MLQTIIISIVLLAIAIMLMGVRVFFIKNGTFPNTHISNSPAMKERGISCATSQEKYAHTHLSPIEEMLKSDNL
ncbi:MAG: hypothetical protein ACOH2V_11345 [Candidatus Saccharimonadaceae bacterium]